MDNVALKKWIIRMALKRAWNKEKVKMKKWLNNLLNALPFNGHKLNIGIGLLGLITVLEHLKVAIPNPELVVLVDAVVIVLGALHKFVK